MQVPLQSAWPFGQGSLHTPFLQIEPSPHSLKHWPQLSGSLLVLTQVLLQSNCPWAQGSTQVVPTQVSPCGQQAPSQKTSGNWQGLSQKPSDNFLGVTQAVDGGGIDPSDALLQCMSHGQD